MRGLFVATQSPTATPTFAPTMPTASPTVIPTCSPTLSMQPTQPTCLPSRPPTVISSNAPTVPVYQMYTVAGNGILAIAADVVSATSSPMNSPQGVFVESSGLNMYFSDQWNYKIRKVNLISGISTILAGVGAQGSGGDNGQATAAQFHTTMGVVAATSSAVFISDIDNHKIRTVMNGIITTTVGSGNSGGNGDGGRATAADIVYPRYICLDTANNLYIALYNSVIRKVFAIDQIITTVVGTGAAGGDGDGGFATAAKINDPFGVYVSSTGVLYLTEQVGQRVRMMGTTNIISLYAGKFHIFHPNFF